MTVGAAIGEEAVAAKAVEGYQTRIDAVLKFVAAQPPLSQPKVGWMEWTEPIFVSGWELVGLGLVGLVAGYLLGPCWTGLTSHTPHTPQADITPNHKRPPPSSVRWPLDAAAHRHGGRPAPPQPGKVSGSAGGCRSWAISRVGCCIDEWL
jgi:hypothetical protein